MRLRRTKNARRQSGDCPDIAMVLFTTMKDASGTVDASEYHDALETALEAVGLTASSAGATIRDLKDPRPILEEV